MKNNNEKSIEISRKELSEMIASTLFKYLTEDNDLSEKQVQVEESIGKKLIEFCKSKGISLSQITVNWNPADRINSYLIRLFVDNNEKYIGLLFDESLDISNSVNLQENFFTIGDEKDKLFFRLINLIISDSEFIKEMISAIKEAIQNADNPEITPEPEDEMIKTSEPEDDEFDDEEDSLDLQ